MTGKAMLIVDLLAGDRGTRSVRQAIAVGHDREIDRGQLLGSQFFTQCGVIVGKRNAGSEYNAGCDQESLTHKHW
jgi:hypothetical protein